MRALTRMRTLAAACALLLVVAGTTAAGPANRFIDRTGLPESPPMTEAGEPDTGSNLTSGVHGLSWYAAWISSPFLGQIPFPLNWFRAGSVRPSLMRDGRR
jgi:hypothetical protein